MSHESLSVLLRKAREGDGGAFGHLCSVFMDDMREMVQRKFARRADARQVRRRIDVDDILQEAMLRAFREVGEWPADLSVGELRARFLVLSKQAVSNTTRRAYFDREYGAATRAAPLDRAVPPATTGPVTRADDVRRALLAAELLPDGLNQAVMHRYLEDNGLKELAAELGVSVDAAKKRVSRGLQKLRALLGEDEAGAR